jgi:hypothetical protein
MTQAGLISRLVQAAADWTRGRYRQDVVVVEHSDPECSEDGRVQTIVELEASPRKGRRQRMICIATLELDGTISCLMLPENRSGTQ